MISGRVVAVAAVMMVLMCGCGKPQINVHEEVVEVDGITSDHYLYFMADSHISICDEKDQELMEKAAAREAGFSYNGFKAQDYFSSLISDACNRDEEMVVLGGDIIDSAMYASINYVENQLDQLDVPYVYNMGNHDFEYGSEYFSETAYNDYLPRLNGMRDGTSYQIRDMGEYIIFAADDSNSQIDAQILEAYRETAAMNKPIVLVVHVPIEPVNGDMSLVDKCIEVWGASDAGKSRVTMGINGVYPDETTQEFLNLVLGEDSPVVLVLAGHIHFYHDDMLNENIRQIVTGAALEGESVYVRLTSRN